MRICTSAVIAALLFISLGGRATSAQGQTGKKLSAREIFYSAPKAAAAPKQSAPPAAKPVEHVAASTTPTPSLPPVSVPEETQPVVRENEAEFAATPVPPESEPEYAAVPVPPEPAGTRPETPEGEVQYVAVAATSESPVPLGLRYSILKRIGPGDEMEVDPDITFRAGDRIRLRVDVNDTGYLYIIHRGSSGVWKPLFPSPEIAGGDNVVHKGRSYDIPHGYVFTFDEQPGEEKLFLVFCRQPETDLEKMVYDMSRRESGEAAPKPAATTPAPKLLLAQNLVSIDDNLVDRLRNAYARDLIIEEVDESAPGAEPETAVYVVNISTAQDSRVVADVSLNHR